MKILSFINVYSLWLYAAGFLVAVFSLREVSEARKDRVQTIFSLEKELASIRENRARTVLVIVGALLVLLTLLKFAVVPSQTLPPLQEPTPTQIVILVPTSTPVTPTPTRTRIPTRPRPTPVPPTETPTLTPAPPLCPQPGVRITSPTMNQVASGQVVIRGTAKVEAFQFYKLEYGIGEDPEQWHSIGELHRTSVVDDVLGTWDVTGFPGGVSKLRLTVVDMTGNFPPPCEVQVIIQR